MLPVKGLPFSPSHRRQEFAEVGKGVVRSRRCLGMILHGEERKLAVPNTLDGAVVEVQVRDLEVAGPGDFVSISNHRKAMVLRRDEHMIRAKVTDRMIAAAVPVRELRRFSAIPEADELMPEADPERR